MSPRGGARSGTTYPPQIIDRACILRAANYSYRRVQRELPCDPKPGMAAIWNWCQEPLNETEQVKLGTFTARLANTVMSLYEIKLEKALDDPDSVSFYEGNAAAGTRIDKTFMARKLAQESRTVDGKLIRVAVTVAVKRPENRSSDGPTTAFLIRNLVGRPGLEPGTL